MDMGSNDILQGKDVGDYFATAQKILTYCGVDIHGSVMVSVLMDKLSPFIQSDKSQYEHLRSHLDPKKLNPAVNVKQLSKALEELSQREDFSPEDSFNLKNSSMMSDTDVDCNRTLLVEELQSELRKKNHLLNLLNQRTEYSERQHDETISSFTAQCESLRAQIQMLREENTSLNHFKLDYEELAEQNKMLEATLSSTREKLECLKQKLRCQEELVERLECKKQSLEESLAVNKDEAHRMNEMYSSRQAALLSQNERLHTELADVNIKFKDQEEYLQQLIKEKVMLEMELRDIANRSCSAEKLNHTIDVSMNDASILRILDSLHQNLKPDTSTEDQVHLCLPVENGSREGNLSLYEELRSSNIDLFTKSDCASACPNCDVFDPIETVSCGVQTNHINESTSIFVQNTNLIEKITPFIDEPDVINSETQTDDVNLILQLIKPTKDITTQTMNVQSIEISNNTQDFFKDNMTSSIQTDEGSYTEFENKFHEINNPSRILSGDNNTSFVDIHKDFESTAETDSKLLRALKFYKTELNTSYKLLQCEEAKNKETLRINDTLRERIEFLSNEDTTCCHWAQEDASTQIDQSCLSGLHNKGTTQAPFLRKALRCFGMIPFVAVCIFFAFDLLSSASRRARNPYSECVEDFSFVKFIEKLIRVDYVEKRPI